MSGLPSFDDAMSASLLDDMQAREGRGEQIGLYCDETETSLSVVNKTVVLGLYASQLEWLQAQTPPTQIRVMISEIIIKDPLFHYNQLLRWLGAPELGSLPTLSETQANVGGAGNFSNATAARLRAFYAPFNKRLYKWMGVKSIPQWEEAQ